MTKCVFGQQFLNQSVWMSEILQPLRFCGVLCIARSVSQLRKTCTADALFLCGSWASCYFGFPNSLSSVVFHSFYFLTLSFHSPVFHFGPFISQFTNRLHVVILLRSLRCSPSVSHAHSSGDVSRGRQATGTFGSTQFRLHWHSVDSGQSTCQRQR